jgi:hypothetical protein
MKLQSLRIIPRTKAGWRSRNLVFAAHVTQLFSEDNGCGKTPLLQALVYALGYPVTFRDDISQHCRAVCLRVSMGGRNLRIWRDIGSGFEVRVRDGHNHLQFGSVSEYTKYLLTAWGMASSTLTSTKGSPSPIYLEHVLPLFYLDQDSGYSTDYFAPSKFLKDQYSEAMRSIFNLAPRHPFNRRKAITIAEDRVRRHDVEIVRLRDSIDSLSMKIGARRKPIEDIVALTNEHIATLNALREASDPIEQADRSIDGDIDALGKESRSLERRRREIDAQLDGIERIRHDIEIEANTLSLNEEARRIFLRFGPICAQPTCGLFANSANTYGKSLLYLRDQLKDLDSLYRRLSAESDQMDAEMSRRDTRHRELINRRDARRKGAGNGALIDAVSEATRAIIELQEIRQLVEGINRLEGDLLREHQEREHAITERDGLSVGRTGYDADLAKIQSDIQTSIVRWMKILNTNNVSRDVLVDADFSVSFGGEALKTIKGSTRTRSILAIRTATIETFVSSTSDGPRFFILDTPRQQDIDRADFARYIDALKELSRIKDVQIVFSSSNYQYPVQDGDVSWSPDFPGEEHPMFLGH